FTSRAHAGMQRGLLSHLSEIARDTLAVELTSFKTIAEAHRPYRSIPFFPAASQRLYLAFLRKLWDGGWKKLCDQYSVLGRLLARAMEQWPEFFRVFARPLKADRGAISSLLGSSGRIASVDYGLSDRHNGGRVSLKVTFDSGSQCIYKPKS